MVLPQSGHFMVPRKLLCRKRQRILLPRGGSASKSPFVSGVSGSGALYSSVIKQSITLVLGSESVHSAISADRIWLVGLAPQVALFGTYPPAISDLLLCSGHRLHFSSWLILRMSGLEAKCASSPWRLTSLKRLAGASGGKGGGV